MNRNQQNSTPNEVVMGLGARPGADMTARLLLALTALYAQKANHSQEEQRHYEELALRLVERVDAATRTTAIFSKHEPARVTNGFPGEFAKRYSSRTSSSATARTRAG